MQIAMEDSLTSNRGPRVVHPLGGSRDVSYKLYHHLRFLATAGLRKYAPHATYLTRPWRSVVSGMRCMSSNSAARVEASVIDHSGRLPKPMDNGVSDDAGSVLTKGRNVEREIQP
jgi:hypothetical protein